MSKLLVSMYHYTRDLSNSRYPEIKGLDYRLFDQQLAFFKTHFNVVTMDQVIEAFNGGVLPENALLLTFDDGYIDNFTVALPLLQKYGFQGSFFIPGKTFSENKVLDVNKIHFILASASVETIKNKLLFLLDDYRSDDNYASNDVLYQKYGSATRLDNADVIFIKRVLQTAIPEIIRKKITDELFREFVGISENMFSRELYMNVDQIRCLKRNGMFIGLHGYDHYWLANLSLSEMEQDVDKALDVMDEFIDSSRWVMNYPYGNCNSAVIEYISKRGCELGFITQVGVADTEKDNKFEIPRLDCNDFPPKSQNYFGV